MDGPELELGGNGRVKILLVDDKPENLVALEAALDILGEELVSVASGSEALRRLLDEDFAAILLDVKMPDLDGFETAELIRSRPRSRHTPILFLTGYRSDEHLFRGYDLGAVDFLFKPIIPEILRSKVSVFVELSRRTAQLERQTLALQRQAAFLQKAEQRFRSLLEAAPDGIVICRASGAITLLNSRAEKLFGYARQDLLDQDVRAVIPEWRYHLPEIGQPRGEQTWLSPTTAELELRVARRDGSSFPAEVTVSPLRIEEDWLAIIAVRDVSERVRIEQERRRAEEQIRHLNADLETLNAELEERVRLRTEELQRSNDELAQFAYVASHDLQEPLRTVSVFTELLVRRYRERLDGEALEFLDHVGEASRRLSLLVRDILAFSRLDAEAAPRSEVVALETALQSALENLRSAIEDSRAEVSWDALPSLPGDETQITRLFQNLLNNAIKYRSELAPRIHVSAARCDGDWVITVADNGIGIDPVFHEKIFGIFKRLHTQDRSGTGIGLAVCRKIVQRHGGRIWVESEPGAGAQFRFSLPAH